MPLLRSPRRSSALDAAKGQRWLWLAGTACPKADKQWHILTGSLENRRAYAVPARQTHRKVSGVKAEHSPLSLRSSPDQLTTPPCHGGNSAGHSWGWFPSSHGRSPTSVGGPDEAAANVFHHRRIGMSQSRAVAVAIVVAFLFVIVASDDGFDTIRKDCPSGAAPKVSHNRPVRMSSDQREGDSGRSG